MIKSSQGEIKKYLTILLVPFLIKCILASTTELTNDEAYYWTYAQHLQWSYFDHPSMIALMIRISTINLLLQNEFFLRLGPMLCGAISTWLIFLIGKRVKDERTGFYSALLFIASPYCCLMAGWLLIPDAPQLVFWLWSVLLMVRIVQHLEQGRPVQRILLLLGFTIGC
jgi:4-amino-4-deoxy-L-arabinose transferase-like glycosyltransferase